MLHIPTNLITGVLIGVASSILTLLAKAAFDRHFLRFKLKSEFEYEQKKKIKEILSRSKMQLINCCESLNHRLWNFMQNYREEWHHVNGSYTDPGNYFRQFVYRFVVVFSCIRRIESEMIYFDTTIADKKDLTFLKYLRLLPQILCDVELFRGKPYDRNYATDHFFRNMLDCTADVLVKNDRDVFTFSDFEAEYSKLAPNLSVMCEFLDGMQPDESRFRWDRLRLFHFSLIAFLNSFGYDFQYTTREKLGRLLGIGRRPQFADNLAYMTERMKLSTQKEMKRALKVLTAHS